MKLNKQNKIMREHYIVYSVDEKNEDEQSISSDSGSITFKDPDYVDLHKTGNGNGYCIAPSSPVLSSTATDKWGSYWSKRERCCCFCNCIITVAVITLITLVILVTKGIVQLHPILDTNNMTKEYIIKPNVTPNPCTTTSIKPDIQTCSDESCAREALHIISKMNKSVNPCEDFYSYACGGYASTTPVTWDSPRKRFNPDFIVQNYFESMLDGLAEDKQDEDSVQLTTLKTIFQSCIHHRDTPPAKLKELVDSLGGFEWGSEIRTSDPSFVELLVDAKLKFGVSPFFEIELLTDGNLALYNGFSDDMIYNMINKENGLRRYRFLKPSDYMYRDEKKDEILQAYKSYIGDFFAYILGINSTMRADHRFVSMVDDVYHLDVYINRVLYSEDMTNLSDGISKCANRMTVGDIQHHFNYEFSWREYLGLILKDSPFYNNYTICYVSLRNAIKDVLSGFSFIAIKRYIIFNTIIESDIFHILPSKIASFAKSQWDRSALARSSVALSDMQCVRQISRYLPVNYVIQNRIANKPNDILRKLFIDLIASLEGIIKDMYWVPIKQKRYLLKDLSDSVLMLEWGTGYESFVKDIGNVTNNYFENLLAMQKYYNSNYFSKNGINRQSYTAKDSSIIRLYNKVIVVSSAALKMVATSTSTIAEVLYGSMGTLLSHTIAELFDIDALLRYLTEDKIDHKVALTIAFRIQCLVDEYNNYVVYSNKDNIYKVRGDLTKSANFKDSLALKVSYNTYVARAPQGPQLPGIDMTPDQLFFLTYAQTMCESINTRGKLQYYIQTEVPHYSPGKYRVIGTLSNFKKFAEAFQCRPGSSMNPQNKCSLF